MCTVRCPTLRARLREQVLPLGIFLFAIGRAAAGSEIIPAELLMDWTPGVNVGVPGGIPERTVIGATVDAATYGDGSTDASAAIGAAIGACPDGQVVYIPAGIYRVGSRIRTTNAHNITIRGAGPGQTVLRSATSDGVLLLGTSDWPPPSSGPAISAGAVKGSTVVTVADTSAVTVGHLARIQQDDLPYVIVRDDPTNNNRLLSAVFMVEAKTSTTVTLTPPVPFTLTESPVLVPFSLPPLVNTGIEDLTIDCDGQSWYGISFEYSYGCWVKNVEITESTSRQIFCTTGFTRGEIRHCYTHDVIGGGPNHEGIDFYRDCSFNLIEDNVTYNGGFPGIILGDSQGGCTGNVIAYNFCYSADTGDPSMAGMDISVSHGPHNLLNLVEGNIAGGMGSDGYFGSTSHITVLRNWFTATHPTADQNLIAVNVGRWNNYFSLVGNILGTTGFSGAGLYMPQTPFSYADEVIYKLGFPNMGNNGFDGTWGPSTPPDYTGQSATGKGLQELDLNVRQTMILHGNFDHANNAIAWEPAISNHTIPDSYFRSTRPEYFGSLAWPPFDPASPPGEFNAAQLSLIPAGYRFVNGSDPPTTSAAPTITVQPAAQIVSAGQAATFSVTATGSAPLSYQWERDGANVTGATSSSYTTPATTPADDGAAFRCVVTNPVGSATSDAATLSVAPGNNAPLISSAAPQTPLTMQAGDTQVFEVWASDADGDGLTYAWALDGASAGDDSPSFSYSPAMDGSHTLNVTVLDGQGGSDSHGWSVTVGDGGGTDGVAGSSDDGISCAPQPASPGCSMTALFLPAAVACCVASCLRRRAPG